MIMIEIDESTTVEIVPSKLNEREVQLLASVCEIEGGDNGVDTPASVKIDIERLVRVMALHESLNGFRYDWRWRYRELITSEFAEVDEE